MNGGVCFGGLREKTSPLSDLREFYVFFVNLETSGMEANVPFLILKAGFVPLFLPAFGENVFSNKSAKFLRLWRREFTSSGAAEFEAFSAMHLLLDLQPGLNELFTS